MNTTVTTRSVKAFDELTFTDNYMFHEVMKENPGLCKRLVELLLDIEVDRLEIKGTEHALATSTEIKGIRMDVYLKDDRGTVYDIEMQTRNKQGLPRRTRYYQSMIDTKNFRPGEDYEELPGSYIVFICTFDPFGLNMHKYEFTDICRQSPDLELGTGAEKVFINAKAKRDNLSEEMRDFLDYLCDNIPRSELTKEIEDDIVRAKANEAKRGEYMFFEATLMDERREARREGRAEGIAEGRAEGIAEGRAEGIAEGRAEKGYEDIDRLVTEDIMDVKRACEILGVSEKDYYTYKENLQSAE